MCVEDILEEKVLSMGVDVLGFVYFVIKISYIVWYRLFNFRKLVFLFLKIEW